MSRQQQQRSGMPEAAKEVIRHDPGAAENITTGTGVSKKLMSDIITKHPGEAGGERGHGMGSGLGEHAAPGSAASGMSHRKDFETDTYRMARGAETPDGNLESLHLHAAHGDEGPGSRADRQLAQEVEGMHSGAGHVPPQGASVTPTDVDPPTKMTHGTHGLKE